MNDHEKKDLHDQDDLITEQEHAHANPFHPSGVYEAPSTIPELPISDADASQASLSVEEDARLVVTTFPDDLEEMLAAENKSNTQPSVTSEIKTTDVIEDNAHFMFLPAEDDADVEYSVDFSPNEPAHPSFDDVPSNEVSVFNDEAEEAAFYDENDDSDFYAHEKLVHETPQETSLDTNQSYSPDSVLGQAHHEAPLVSHAVESHYADDDKNQYDEVMNESFHDDGLNDSYEIPSPQDLVSNVGEGDYDEAYDENMNLDGGRIDDQDHRLTDDEWDADDITLNHEYDDEENAILNEMRDDDDSDFLTSDELGSDDYRYLDLEHDEEERVEEWAEEDDHHAALEEDDLPYESYEDETDLLESGQAQTDEFLSEYMSGSAFYSNNSNESHSGYLGRDYVANKIAEYEAAFGKNDEGITDSELKAYAAVPQLLLNGIEIPQVVDKAPDEIHRMQQHLVSHLIQTIVQTSSFEKRLLCLFLLNVQKLSENGECSENEKGFLDIKMSSDEINYFVEEKFQADEELTSIEYAKLVANIEMLEYCTGIQFPLTNHVAMLIKHFEKKHGFYHFRLSDIL